MKLRGVFGSGGCGRGILPLVREQFGGGAHCVFVDDAKAGTNVNGAEVLSLAEFAEASESDKAICVAVAQSGIRRDIAARCKAENLAFFSTVATNHVSMDDVELGDGALVSPFTSFTSNIRIGDHFHCNLYSYVEHDCVIGDYVTFAPAVRCNGNVTIGDNAYIGSNAVIRQGLSIGANATIGMGAVVTKDVPADETWVGNPARPIG